jgi:hypothetical protein
MHRERGGIEEVGNVESRGYSAERKLRAGGKVRAAGRKASRHKQQQEGGKTQWGWGKGETTAAETGPEKHRKRRGEDKRERED